MRRGSRIVVASTCVLLALGAACSSDGGSDDPPAAPTNAPSLGTGDGSGIEALLLTPSDVTSLEGAPADLEEVDTADRPSYENPDGRGPCGAEVKHPRPGTGELVMFRAAGVLLTEELFAIEPAAGEKIVATFRADIDPDCASFTSHSDAGVQRNDLLHEVELSPDAGNAVATLSYVETEGGLPLYVGTALFQDGGTLGMLSLASGSEIPDETFGALVGRAASKLRGD